jgi:hypothetical protein
VIFFTSSLTQSLLGPGKTQACTRTGPTPLAQRTLGVFNIALAPDSLGQLSASCGWKMTASRFTSPQVAQRQILSQVRFTRDSRFSSLFEWRNALPAPPPHTSHTDLLLVNSIVTTWFFLSLVLGLRDGLLQDQLGIFLLILPKLHEL